MTEENTLDLDGLKAFVSDLQRRLDNLPSSIDEICYTRGQQSVMLDAVNELIEGYEHLIARINELEATAPNTAYRIQAVTGIGRRIISIDHGEPPTTWQWTMRPQDDAFLRLPNGNRLRLFFSDGEVVVEALTVTFRAAGGNKG